jgi:hypothetical protein
MDWPGCPSQSKGASMNIYKAIMDYILKLPVLTAWRAAKSLLKHAVMKQLGNS